MGSMLQQVFISYRHESSEHAQAVRQLGELLREANLPVVLDQFFLDDNPGGPNAGWPKWSDDAANESACVLVIASQGWFAASEKSEPAGMGLGAATEADVLRQYLYNQKGENTRIRLAFLPATEGAQVPARWQPWHQFHPFRSNNDREQLIRWIAQRLQLEGIEPPTINWPVPAPFQPDLANRKTKEWPAVVNLLAGSSKERILLFEGHSGVGKSELLNQIKLYAEQLQIPIGHIDFKGGTLNITDVLDLIGRELSTHLPNFARKGLDRMQALQKDLRALRRPVLMIFDTYEFVATNQSITEWLNVQLLSEIATSLGLLIVVAGQKVPELSHAGWRNYAHHFRLEPITEVEHWNEWMLSLCPTFKGDLSVLVMATEGQPSLMANLCTNLAKRAATS